MAKKWRARFVSKTTGEYLEVSIGRIPNKNFKDDYGNTITPEMEARRVAMRANRKAAERYGREEYELEYLEQV